MQDQLSPFFQGVFGIICFVFLAWILSENRKSFDLKVVLTGIIVQFVIAGILLYLDIFVGVFQGLNKAVVAVQQASEAGTSFVFGYLGGGQLPFEEIAPGLSYIFAFRVLTILFVMGSISALLWHWRILPFIINSFAWGLRRTMGVGGAVGFSACANIFVSMVESPLLIRPYLQAVSRSELFMIMAVGMATIAGVLLIPFAVILKSVVPDPVAHILIASVISVPAAIVIARLMVPPHKNEKAAEDNFDYKKAQSYDSAIDALVKGALNAMYLFANSVVLLVVFIALVHLVDQILGVFSFTEEAPLTLVRIFSYIFTPLSWFMGIPWHEVPIAAELMATKTVLNEFIAYVDFSQLPENHLSANSKIILTYALCGFANFGGIGIISGAMIAMVPERQADILSLAAKSIVAGTLATCMTGTVAGVLLSF